MDLQWDRTLVAVRSGVVTVLLFAVWPARRMSGPVRRLQYADVAPVYITGSLLSIIGAIVVLVAVKRTSRSPRSSTTILLIITTLLDCLYSIKFSLSALAYEFGATDDRHSFHLIPVSGPRSHSPPPHTHTPHPTPANALRKRLLYLSSTSGVAPQVAGKGAVARDTG